MKGKVDTVYVNLSVQDVKMNTVVGALYCLVFS